MDIALPLLFAAMALGAGILLLGLLRSARRPRQLERYRLLFVFGWCLALACLVPLWLAKLLTAPVRGAHAAAVSVNLVGWALTLWLGRAPGRASADPDASAEGGIRTYTVYYQGAPLGLVTKGAFAKLNQLGLLKKQQTVELVDEYRRLARDQGAVVQLFKNQDGTQTLIKVTLEEDQADL